MNLENLKNTYAQEQGYEDWDDYVIKHFVSSKYSMTATLSVFENHMDKICIRAQKAALEKAAEKAKTTTEEYYVGEVSGHIGLTADRVIIDRTSITNPENLIR